MTLLEWVTVIGAISATVVTPLIIFFTFRSTNIKFEKLQGQIDGLRTDLNGRIDGLRTDLNGRIDRLQDSLQGQIDKLHVRIDSVHVRIGKLQDDLQGQIDKLCEGLNKVSHATSSIVAFLGGKSGEKISDVVDVKSLSTAAKNSPASLTQKGEDIAVKIDAQAIVDKYRRHILLPEDANRLTIQETCFTFAILQLCDVVNRSELDVIEDAIYEADGNRKEILIIHAILFRDAAFAERGMPIPQRPVPQEKVEA